MNYKVIVLKKALKTIQKMPEIEKIKLKSLVCDLEEKGAVQPSWPNYSKLGEDKFHCHLLYKWVACWKWEKNSIIIEVYYVGSREKAPY